MPSINTEILLLIAIILILLDLFFLTDLPTLIAYGIFSFCIAVALTDTLLYQIIVGILGWWIMAAFHYFIWRKFIKAFSDRFVAPTKLQSGIGAQSGKEATIQNVSDMLLVNVNDELFPFKEQTDLPCYSGDKVIIIAYINEKMLVKKIS